MRRLLLKLSALSCLLMPASVSAQSAEDWLERGHQAAEADRHADAIAAYERALEVQPSLRGDLLARLGRQYLWADRPERAVQLLREYLAGHEQCDVRSDYGLALAWSGALGSANDQFDVVIARCPAEAATARLRKALVLRWQDRPSRAAMLYRELLDDDDADVRHAAEIGLGYVAMLQDDDRLALQRFEAARRTAATAAQLRDARTGAALMLARLGELRAASDTTERLRMEAALPRDLRELADRIAWTDRPEAQPRFSAVRDADGTSHTRYSIAATLGWSLRGRAGVRAGGWTLENASAEYDATRLSAEGEYRWSQAFALSGEAGVSRITPLDWNPATGELNAVITPGDRLRIDLSGARLMITDNVAAVAHRLTGAFASAGTDVRVTTRTTLVGAADITKWSTGNRRMRLRAAVRERFEGVPRLTLELPVLLQLYDEPFDFGLFSPELYIEAGPAANLYMRVQRVWNVSLYGRVGGQKEAERTWGPFGTLQFNVWRDLQNGWSLQSGAGWSNSNLASSGSFRRTSFTLGLARRF